MIKKIKTISYDNRAIFFWILVGVSILSLCVYVYAIQVTARHIAKRQVLEEKIAEISSNLNSLEFAYIDLKNSVTIEMAYDHGFQEIRNPLYVSRTRPASLSLNSKR
jgi:hypothetical protein